MKKLVLAAFIATSGLSLVAQAQDRTEDEDLAQQAASAEDEVLSEEDSRLQEVTCRTENVLGSRTRVNRVCMTRAEWNRLHEETRRGADRMSRNANLNMACATWDPAGAGRGCVGNMPNNP